MLPDAAIVLTGGSGRRLGGVDKASLTLGGVSLLERMLGELAGLPAVVVGEPAAVPDGVLVTREEPPGGGPAAAVVAGLLALRDGDDEVSHYDEVQRDARGGLPGPWVAVLAVDQPGIRRDTLRRLMAAARPGDRGAVVVAGGRRQYGAAVVAATRLLTAAHTRQSWHGVALRALLDPLLGAEVPARGAEGRDIDTPTDLGWWQSRTTDGKEN